MKLHKAPIVTLLLILAANVVFFGLVNPVNVASPLLFAGFLVLAVDLVGLWYTLLWSSRKLLGWPRGRLRRPVVALAAFCIVVLALQSIGQMTAKDVVALSALAAIFWFYSTYAKPKQA